MQCLPKQVASVFVAVELARELLSEDKDLLYALPRFARLCWEADYPSELTPLYMLDAEVHQGQSVYGRPISEVICDVRGELVRLERYCEGRPGHGKPLV